MDYAALETELKDVLVEYFTDNDLNDLFDAREMPENQTELLQDYEKSMCNVQYLDSLYGEPASTEQIQQEETVKVGVFMMADTVKDEKGSYALTAVVKKALLGYKPADASSRMWISDYRGWTINDAQAGNMLEFSFKTRNVQTIEEPDGDVPLSTETVEGEPVLETGPLIEVDADLWDANQEPAVKVIKQVDMGQQDIPEE